MRVAIVTPPFVPVPPSRYGGTELVVAELIDALVACGDSVTLFASGDSTGGLRSPVEVRSSLPTACWPPDPALERRHASSAWDTIQDAKFDVIHSHAPMLLPLTRPSQPVVYTIHHAWSRELGLLYRACPWIRYVAISERQRELSGIPDAVVIHHGLSPDRYRIGPLDPSRVVFIGRLSQQKGPHVAIEVAGRAGLSLDLCGRPHPEDREYFAAEVEPRLPLPHVQYHGEVDHLRKVLLLASARALLFPVAWEEPFGLVALEAMLCGCPVVAFDRGSAREIIDDGITGFIARDARHMEILLRDATLPGQFDRERCRIHAARRFPASGMAARYRSLYALTGSAGRRARGDRSPAACRDFLRASAPTDRE